MKSDHSFFLLVHIGHWVIWVHWRSPLWLLPPLWQSPFQRPQILTLLYRVFIILEQLNVCSLPITLRSRPENRLLVHLSYLLLQLLNLFVQRVLNGHFLRTETSWKVSPLITPCFLRGQFVVDTKHPVPVLGYDVHGLFNSGLIGFLWHLSDSRVVLFLLMRRK